MPDGEQWALSLDRALAGRQALSQLRRRRVWVPTGPVTLRDAAGRELVNFASNNYLGLTHHPRMVSGPAVYAAGSGAAGLVTGHTAQHEATEAAVAAWKGVEAAVLLPSGYQANFAAVQTLAAIGDQSGRGVRFLMDKLVHASLIDAVRASGAAVRIFPHNHLGKLERLLREAPDGDLQVVVTESIFSMDGDQADLAGIVRLKAEYSFFLLLDEAHASGVYGTGGAGLAAEMGLKDAVDAAVVTFSKALGCAGGAIGGKRSVIDAVLNFGRAYIYSTAIPPALAHAIGVAVALIQEEPEHAARVRLLSRQFRYTLAGQGWAVAAGDSPIIPIILGSEAAALAAATQLEVEGLIVPAIRPPTVPRGGSRLRITLSAAHTDAQIAALLAATGQLHPSKS